MSVLANLTSSKTGTFCFAFGSNMAPTQMRGRLHDRSSSIPVAVARLDGYKWIICRRGYANVVELPAPTEPSDETTIWGIVYNMTPSDETVLDGFEGCDAVRNSNPEPNPNSLQQAKIPFLQNECDYNKHYLPVTVTKWLEDPLRYGTNAQVGENITVLVYVDELRTQEGTIKHEYIGRMNRAIDQSAELGAPRSWMDKIMRKDGWVKPGIYPPPEYFGDERGYISDS